MAIKSDQLLINVIIPTLKYLDLYSESAANLLLGTAAQESHMGTYLKQVNGPALGIYQIEPATHEDVLKNFLYYRPELYKKVGALCSAADFYGDRRQDLICNLRYATAIARCIYARFQEKLPEADDVEGLAKYWKRYYNTEKGKGTVEEFKVNYEKFVNI